MPPVVDVIVADSITVVDLATGLRTITPGVAPVFVAVVPVMVTDCDIVYLDVSACRSHIVSETTSMAVVVLSLNPMMAFWATAAGPALTTKVWNVCIISTP